MILGCLTRAHAVAAANALQDVGSVRHAFHTTGNHDVVAAGFDQIVGEHGGFHAGAAELIDGGSSSVIRQAGLAHSLAGRALF